MITETSHILRDLLDYAEYKINRTDEPTVISEFKRKALLQFRALGFPTTKLEEWKYTNVKPWLNKLESRDESEIPETQPRLHFGKLVKCILINTVNGRFDASSSERNLPSGLHVFSFSDAARENAPKFNENFGTQTNLQDHFSSANSALFTDGLFIYIEPGTIIDAPIHIVHKTSKADTSFFNPRQLMVIGESAVVTILETFETEKEDTYSVSNAVTELLLKANAKVEHCLIQTQSVKSVAVRYIQVHVPENANYENINFSFPGSPFLRNAIHVLMDGKYAGCNLYGLYLSGNDQLVDNHTCVEHLSSDCNSSEQYKGVLLDTSTSVFNGKVIVHPKAQRTNAFQQNNNLLMDDCATVYTKPELEIFADDVKCSHGATLGNFDHDALFYLQTRGITEKTALDMLMYAFSSEIVSRLSSHEMKRNVEELIRFYLRKKSGDG